MSTWPYRLAEYIARSVESQMPRPLSPGHRAAMVRLAAKRAVREMCLDLPPMTEEQDHDRAGGGCVCARCGLEYRDHPQDPMVISNAGELFLTILCDGRRVKL